MKAILFSVFYLTHYFTNFAFAQEWVKIEPNFVGNENGVYDMSLGTFVNADTGWFAQHFYGDIWKTTDGGENWVMLRDSSFGGLLDLKFIDELNGWAVGAKLWQTTDGGHSWKEIQLPQDYVHVTILSYPLYIFNYKKWLLSDAIDIYLTIDGGMTWEKQTNGKIGCVTRFFFVDSLYGWAGSYYARVTDAGSIFHSNDGGQSWQIQKDIAADSPLGVFFLDRNRGFVAGDYIMSTEDGGQTWQSQHLAGGPVTDIIFTDDSTGWAVGLYGMIAQTKNGGKGWNKIESGTNTDLGEIVFVENGETGYIFGRDKTLLRYKKDITSIRDRVNLKPTSHRLYQNYPNPFNATTKIQYEVTENSNITLGIYNVEGELITMLVNAQQHTGAYQIIWDGKNNKGKEVSSGVYISVLKAGSFIQSRKLALIR